jgi:hypothetical protein
VKRRTAEEKYKENVRKQQKILEEFAEYEFEWAKDLLRWYDVKKLDIPEDVYRACAFFSNREHRKKPGSLTLLYEMFVRCNNELPEVTRERAFDVLRFKYMMYARVLEKGGY